MATIKELIPIDTDSISGVTITSGEAGFLAAAHATAGTVNASACVTASSAKDITGLNNITCNGTNSIIVAKKFDDGIADLEGGVLTGVTFAALTELTSPVINGTLTGDAIDDTTLSTDNDAVPSSAAVRTYVDAKTVDNSDWSGTDLAVENGGTGVSTLDDGGVLIGNGTNDVVVIAPPTSAGKVLTSGATATSNPTWENASGGVWIYGDLLNTTGSGQLLGQYTSIPAGATEVRAIFNEVASTGTYDNVAVLIGSQADYDVSGIEGTTVYFNGTTFQELAWLQSATPGQDLPYVTGTSLNPCHGIVEMIKENGTNTWMYRSILSAGDRQFTAAGKVPLTGAADRIKVFFAASSSETFSTGSQVEIWYKL